MGNTARGKHALFISDRSGLAYPYREMVKEWNGARVHTSEYEPKQPQLEPTPYSAGGGIIANLTLPGDFAFQTVSSESMVPADPSTVSAARQATMRIGSVTINIS